ncbi:sterile alpha motif domain-containing protein 9 [Gadus chalcogrammus]|uniref:sterile alpha motif domain-containing protein 9 n=1 Tax=Gadus chalcogrammus TaxID=1042646 RepID=UPI0024C49C7C|nr:sterile alpha motif domain-containing protein 9 [Gadus chalcogrammus]
MTDPAFLSVSVGVNWTDIKVKYFSHRSTFFTTFFTTNWTDFSMAEGTTNRNEVKIPKILDILDKDVFKGEIIDPDEARQTEVNFYRGAPPLWLNFDLAEQNTDEGRFIKRDGYQKLHREIMERKPVVRLKHKPGSGGTTLAMQLLWDLRTLFRCAVLVDPTLESSLIASAVFNLYTAGESHNNRTVLLLVQGGNVNTLQKSFVAELSERKIDSVKPVVVILNCVRIAHINAGHSAGVKLLDTLTDKERKKFDDKKEWLNRQYTEENGIIPTEFHGFNIMQSNFSKDYVKRACDVFKTTDCRPSVPNRGVEFTACLCLLNSYVPGSVMLESHCEKFLSSFEKEMGPFRHLMVSFNPNGIDGQKVLRMAHPMIAEQGTQSLHGAGCERSETALILLQKLCTEEHTPFLSKFMKALLMKRQKAKQFSRLILDIKNGNAETGKQSCLSVLNEAVKKFPQTGSYPQTLSRFCYRETEDFFNARKWAERAKQIAPENSYFADTLGQVYKHFLYRKVSVLESNPNTLTEVLDLATKAFEAFEHGEILAGKEQENRDGLSQQSEIFNYMPKIAYLQVANKLFEYKGVIESVAKRTNQYPKYENLKSPLSNQIQERARFINMLLSYSQESFEEENPDYFLQDARTCYEDYTGYALPEGLGEGPTEKQLSFLHENWQNDTQEPGLNLKMKVEKLKSSFHETHEKYFRSRYLLPRLYLETSDGTKVRVGGVVRCYKVYTTMGDEEIELDVDPAKQLALWKSGTVTFELGFTIRGPTAYDIQFPD